MAIITQTGTSPNKPLNLAERVEALENLGQDTTFWIPPEQPAMPWGKNGVPHDRNPEKFVKGLYEPLRAKNRDYMKHKILGRDASGKWDIHRYVLEPKNYTKTIIVSAGTHGNEFTASFALARVIHHLVNDWRSNAQLAYIRKNVRVVVLPINNPWSFANSKRQNANGVDLNRNMGYLWDYITGTSFQEGGTYYKGTAPFSEPETKILVDTFEEFKDALSYVDFHTINTIKAEHIVFTPRYKAQFRHIFNDNISKLFKTGNRIVNGTTALPSIAVHCAVNHDMTTANPEWYNGLYGGNRDSVEMTEAVKWFANVVISASKLEHKASILDETEPFSKVMMYDKKESLTPIVLDSLTYKVYGNVPHATYDMNIRRHGIVKASGYAKVTLSEPATLSINPIIYQKYHPENDFAQVKDQATNEVVQTLQAGTHVIPFDARYHTFPHNHNEGGTNRPEATKYRLRLKVSTGTATIESFRTYIDYVPSEMGKPYEIIDFTGKESQPEGTDFKITFPDPTKFGVGDGTDSE